MRYCHECGAEVAPDDSFCPFCGIVLQPIVPVSADSAELSPAAGIEEAPAQPETVEPEIPQTEAPSLEAAHAEARQSENLAEEPPPPIPFEATGDLGVPAELPAQNNGEEIAEEPVIAVEPETVSTSGSRELFLNQQATETVKTGEPLKPENPPLGTSPLAEEQNAEEQNSPQHSEADEIFIATIPNVALDSFTHEASEVPFEELRQDDIESSEPPAFSSPEERQPEFDAQPEQEPAFQSQQTETTGASPLLPEISEPAREPEFTAENSVEPAISPAQPESSEVREYTPDFGSAEFHEDRTLISQPLAEQSAPQSDVLGSNPADAAVPRPTEANQSKETPGSKSPKLKPLDDGTVLNKRYEIVRRIGGGGMGAVYLANDRNLGGVTRAVKEMIQAYVDDTQHEKAVEDFRREALLLSSLEHPAIPTIYDYFVDEQENRFYLVMKYISGGDLAARFRSSPTGKIDEQTMTEWAIQIADVLDYLHNHEPPIVYRDLKPSNIMIDGKTGRVMLVDFGIARWVNKEEKGNTAVGTMGYAPSEQYAGNAEPRSDIYALGATMFHLLTAADPQNNPLLIFDFTKNPRPRAINPHLSVEMEQVLMKAVEYNANMRYSSAAEMRSALLDHLERIRAGKLTFAAPEAEPATVLQAPPPVSVAKPAGMAFCGFCGERIAANDMFCAYCGSKQPEAERVQAAAQAAFPVNKTSARLVVETGTFDEPAFMLEKETNIIGREDRRSNIFPEVDLTRYDVASPKISRRHARIWRQGATYMIEDLGSANGTMLVTHDAKIVKLPAHQPHTLSHGDKLKLGETTLHFYMN